MKEMSVPLQLRHPLFFSERTVSITQRTPFLDEILYYHGETASPLLDAKEKTKTFLSDFHSEAGKIGELFRSRKGDQAKPAVLFHLSRLIQMLYWHEGRLCPPLHELVGKSYDLASAPLNASERITFIMNAPGHFQSFIQLNELFKEFEKKAAVHKSRPTQMNEDKS